MTSKPIPQTMKSRGSMFALTVICFMVWGVLVSDTGRLAIEKMAKSNSEGGSLKDSPSKDDFSGPPTPSTMLNSLKPFQVLQDYVLAHSKQALQGLTREELMNRKYMVAPYNCPHQAGNVFTIFLNMMVLAIATNRTLVWTYEGINTIEECEPLLERANWIPSLEELLELRDQSRDEIDVFIFRQHAQLLERCKSVLNETLHGSHCRSRVAEMPSEEAENLALSVEDPEFLTFHGMSGCQHSMVRGWDGRFNLTDPSCFHYVRGLFPSALVPKRLINQLFDEGLFFLYGMLFRMSFTMTKKLITSVSNGVDENAFSIGIHSRHVSTDNDGSDVTKQKECLLKMMERKADHLMGHSLRKDGNGKCQVAIMSDRQATNEALSEFVANDLGCVPLTVASHRHLRIEEEHGPFEGAGFFQDLILVSQVRDGFISTTRSSSALVLESIVYEQVMRGDPPGDVCFPVCACGTW